MSASVFKPVFKLIHSFMLCSKSGTRLVKKEEKKGSIHLQNKKLRIKLLHPNESHTIKKKVPFHSFIINPFKYLPVLNCGSHEEEFFQFWITVLPSLAVSQVLLLSGEFYSMCVYLCVCACVCACACTLPVCKGIPVATSRRICASGLQTLIHIRNLLYLFGERFILMFILSQVSKV